MKPEKKAAELLVMRYFIEKCPDWPKGKLVQYESPDFILRINRKKQIGVELTSIFARESETSHQSEKIVAAIKHAISSKNEKLLLYNKIKPAETWLIIYADDVEVELEKPIFQQLEPTIADTGFDRIYLFSLFNGEITKLIGG